MGGGNQVVTGSNEHTGLRNGSYWRESEYRLPPECPLESTPRGDSVSPSPPRREGSPRRYSSISMASPALAQAGNSPSRGGSESNCEQVFSATLDLGGQFIVADDNTVMILNAGAAANPAGSKRLEQHNKCSERWP